MIFVYENQFPASNISNIRNLKAFAYKEASVIYKTLYHLPGGMLNGVKEVICIIQGNNTNTKKLHDILRLYSASIDDYPNDKDLMYEIWNWFPTDNELVEIQKREIIETLIRSSVIISIDNQVKSKKNFTSIVNKSDSYLFISSIIKNSLPLVEVLQDTQVTIVNDSKIIKLNVDEQLNTINRNKYLNIYNKLIQIRSRIDKIKIEPWKIRGYKPGDPLDYFQDSFMKKITSLMEDVKTNVHVIGQDTLLSKRAIERLLIGEDRVYYSMPTELREMNSIKKSTVISNFDSINNSNDYYELHNRVKGIENIYFVILQALRNVHSKYFSHYEDIELPRTDEIRRHISGLFLSLLLNRYLDKDECWNLYTIVDKNLLESVIPEIDNLEILYKCIKDCSPVNYKDLVSNISFWYSLERKITSEIESQRNKSIIPDPKNIIFENINEEWIIHGIANIPPIVEGRNVGLIYLLIIIAAKKQITSTEIMDLSVKYRADKDISSKRAETKKLWGKDIISLLESDRKTISGAISRLKKYITLFEFVEEHISQSKGNYYFDNKGIYTVDILPNDILNSLQ